MVAIVAPDASAGAAAMGHPPRMLAQEHLLLYSSAPGGELRAAQVLGAETGSSPRGVSFIMLTEAMIELARAGAGVGVLPRWSAQRAIASARAAALSITRRGVRRQWTAATLAAQPEPPYLVATSST